MTENTAVEQVPYHYLTPVDTQPVAPTVAAPAVPVQTTPVVESPLVPVSNKRVDRLAQAREQKIDILGTRTGYAETDRRSNTFVNTEDGYRESTQNKVTNDFTEYELDYLGKELNNRFGVVKTPEGLFRQDSKGNRTPYEGDPNDLMSYYEFATKDGKIKRGTWGGDDPRDRYSEAYLKSKNKNDFVGAEGVDVNQLLTHYYMPREVVKEYEALRHGSTEAIKNRAVRQSVDKARLPEYQAAKQRIGTGMTEVYNRAESLQPDNFNGADLWARANAKYQLAPRTPEEQAEYDERIREELLADAKRKSTADYLARGLSSSGAPDTVLNRTGNTAAAFASSFTRGLVLDSGAAIGDLVGLDESTIGTPESRRAYADEMFGYDANYSQATMKRVSERVASMYDKKELDMGDMLDITTDVFSTPEILADSLGMIAGLAVGFGKFTKVGKAISGVEKEYRAGALTKTEAKEAIKRINSTHTLVEKASKLAAANVGYGATVAGMTENAVQEFAANNEGKVDGLDVLRIGAFQATIASVDRFASKIALNDIPGIRSLNMFSPESTRALREVVSEMPADVYAQTASSVAKVLVGTAKLGSVAGLEGLTEYSQTMAEIFSTKYATEKYGDDFGKLFADRANQIEALTGAAVGVVMGGQMHSTNLAAQGAQSLLVNGAPQATNTNTNTQESDLSPEAQQELDDDHKTYAQTFNRLKNQLRDAQLAPTTLSEHLSDLEELKRTRSAAEKKIAPEVLERADSILTEIQDQVAAMVMSHPDGNLPLTRGTSTAVSEMEAVQNNPDNSLGSRPLSETEQKALAETAIDIIAARKGESITDDEVLKLNNFGSANGVETARIERIIKSHASVESEATIEDRGILGRERALDLMLGSGTTSKKRVQKTYDETTQWLSTTLSSIEQLEEGIRAAEEKATTANNSARKGVKVKPVYTQYRKFGSTSDKPKYFDIEIKYDGNQYTADTTQALRLISDKKRTATGLNNLLNKYHQEASEYIDPASRITAGKSPAATETSPVDVPTEPSAATKALAEAKEARQQRLIDLAIEEEASTLPENTGRTAEAVQSDIASAMETVREDFLPLAKRQVEESLKEGETLTEEAVTEQLSKNIRTFMKNRTTKSVRDLRAALEQGSLNIDDVDVSSPALRALVKADIAANEKFVADSRVLINAWKEASALRLKGNELIGALNEGLATVGKHAASERKDDSTVVLREVGNTILDTSAGATNNIKSYSVEYEVIGIDGSVYTVTEHPKFNPSKYPVGKVVVREGKGTYKVLNVNEVTHNPAEYLTVSATTPLNTVETASLPAVFQRVADRIEASLTSVIPALSKDEVSITAGKREVEAEAAVRRMLDSPARSLIYDKDGKVNSNLLAAMAISIGDLVKNDSFKLTLGSKDKATLASMFRVSESEVTAGMRKVASENGTLAKSVAHNLGTSALKALGISKLKNNETNRGQYERVVTDLGNHILAVAEKEGILKMTQVSSDKLAELYRDGDITDTASVTWFVHIPAVKAVNKSTGLFTTVLNSSALSLVKDYDLIADFIPDAASSRKEPRFGSPIPEAEQNTILASIRNDVVGGNIPAEAKETLRSFMNTPYEMDLANAGKFLEELKNPQTKAGVLKSLGYVTITANNPDYAKLTFEEKEIQEAINRDVENSIAQIQDYYEAIQNGLPNEMYFPFYYTSNHRYMMNSNTLNGQADKLHRFFLYPKEHNVEYSVDRLSNTFTYNYIQDGESKSIDSSLYVRAALAQAMGIDIDKVATSEIVRIGNELLSMTTADAVTARESMLANGTFTLTNETGAVVYEPAHLSHGLQGLEFIRGYKSTSDSTFKNALSAEYDALTSGFSNKVQQFGTVSSRSEQLRRVGIVDPSNPVAELLQDPNVGVNDMLSDKSLLDSYKNLAKDTILDLARQVKTLPPKAAKLFDSVSALLPGADQRNVAEADVVISSALRSLFKPGFMIFNYSAGINRITTNLGEELVSLMMKEIASSDYDAMVANGKAITLEQKAAAEAIAAIIYTGPKKADGISLAELQRRIRNEPLSSLQTVAQVWAKDKFIESVRPLDQHLIKEVISPTYGVSVEESFVRNFEEFIEIQNVTNDAFKLSFAVFGKLLQQRITAYRAATDNAPITEQQLLTMIGELREAFPVIAGPLSKNLEDGVHVYTTETRTPKGTLATTVSPALHYAEGSKVKTRSLNPLIKSIIAAANAGAVLPFHALDGAQMSRMTNEFVTEYMSKIQGSQTGAGILPVHDAVIPPLPFSDILGYIYNKNTVELNSTYSVIGEIQKMVERVQSILSDNDTGLNVDDTKVQDVMSLSFISNKAIKENNEEISALTKELKALQSSDAHIDAVTEKKIELKTAKERFSFSNSFARVKDTVAVWNTKVEQERTTMYADGTKVGVLVTTPGGVYTVGSKEVDLSYLENLHDLYETVTVNVAPVVEATTDVRNSTEVDGVSTDIQARVSVSDAVFYAMPPQLRRNQEYVDSAAGILLLKDLVIKPTSVITVLVNDKTIRSDEEALSDAELHAVDLAWSQTVLVGNTALRKGATLVFSQEAVTTQDLGDSSIMGESYVFHRITESSDYTVTPEVVDGITVYKVRQRAPDDTVTLIDDVQDVTIPELDKVTNKNGYKNIINRYKEQTKRCK